MIVVNDLLQTWRNDGDNVTTYKYDTDGDIIESVNRTAGTTETITYNYDNSKKGLSYDGILSSWFSIYNDFDLKEFFTKKRLTQFTQVIEHPKSTPVTYTAIFQYVDVDGKTSKITRYYTFSSSTVTNEDPEIASFVLKYQVKK